MKVFNLHRQICRYHSYESSMERKNFITDDSVIIFHLEAGEGVITDDVDRIVSPIHVQTETYEERTIDVLKPIFNS